MITRAAKATLEELLRLDPNRVWSWIDLGDIWVTTGSLGEAAKAFQGRRRRCSANQKRARSRRRPTTGSATCMVTQGDLAAALKSYQDSLAIIERLARSDPGNSEWQRDLAVSYENIGAVQEAQGELAAALKSYQDGLAIFERLARSDPGNAGWQRDLSVSYNKTGEMQEAQGDLAAALKSYQDSLAIRERLRERLALLDPGKFGVGTRDLAVSYGT